MRKYDFLQQAVNSKYSQNNEAKREMQTVSKCKTLYLLPCTFCLIILRVHTVYCSLQKIRLPQNLLLKINLNDESLEAFWIPILSKYVRYTMDKVHGYTVLFGNF